VFAAERVIAANIQQYEHRSPALSSRIERHGLIIRSLVCQLRTYFKDVAENCRYSLRAAWPNYCRIAGTRQ